MTNTKNQIKSIILTILAVVIIASMICAIIGVFEKDQQLEVSAETTTGSNGEVEEGYVSDYRTLSGVHVIQDESSLAAYLTASGSANSPVYGYLAKSFSTNRTMLGTEVNYHYLDGCGYTITLTDATGYSSDTFVSHYNSQGTSSTVSPAQVNIENHFAIRPDGYKPVTPYGYAESGYGHPYQMGYFAGFMDHCDWSNLKVQFDG